MSLFDWYRKPQVERTAIAIMGELRWFNRETIRLNKQRECVGVK